MTKTAREHEMFRPGDKVLVSVSGGPDSVCLLYSLWYLRRLFKIRVEVFHFDHRLRTDSAKDAEYVRRLAERLRLPFHRRAAEDAPSKGISVEAWATVRRMNTAVEVRNSIGASVVAEGHTLDDQAETVLLNLIRGTGLEGLAGIWPGGYRYGRSGLAQPLLDVEREEIEMFCRALRLRPQRDPMNDEIGLLRNVIRLKVIPQMERATHREIKRTIARSAELLHADRNELHGAAIHALSQVLEGPLDRPPGTDVRLDAAALRSLPEPIASRVVRLAVYRVMASDDIAPWTREAVDAVLDLANGRPGRKRNLPNGSTAIREAKYVSLSRTSPESRE